MIDAENMKYQLLPEEKEAPKTAHGEGDEKTFDQPRAITRGSIVGSVGSG